MGQRAFYRRMTVIAAALWVLGAVVGLGWIWLVSSLGDAGCEHRDGDSNYGELTWSLFPPGSKCTWTVSQNGVDEVEGPSWHGTAYLVSMVIGAGATALIFRASRETGQ